MYKVQIKDFNDSWINASREIIEKETAHTIKCQIQARFKMKSDEIRIIEVESIFF